MSEKVAQILVVAGVILLTISVLGLAFIAAYRWAWMD